MKIGKFDLHLHSMSVHFTNALYPAAVFFLILFQFSAHDPFRHTYFYLMLLGTFAVPVSYLTGIIEWKQKYRGAGVRIFRVKYRLGPVLFGLGALCTFWYGVSPGIAIKGGAQHVLFLLLNLSIIPLNVYLGYLGGRLVFGGGH
jgi:uncharacterized membrane protein